MDGEAGDRRDWRRVGASSGDDPPVFGPRERELALIRVIGECMGRLKKQIPLISITSGLPERGGAANGADTNTDSGSCLDRVTLDALE